MVRNVSRIVDRAILSRLFRSAIQIRSQTKTIPSSVNASPVMSTVWLAQIHHITACHVLKVWCSSLIHVYLNVLMLLSWIVVVAGAAHQDVWSVLIRLLVRFVLEVLFCMRGLVELNVLKVISPIWSPIQLWFTIVLLVVRTARAVSVTLTMIAGAATKDITFTTICAWHLALQDTSQTISQVYACYVLQLVLCAVHYQIAQFVQQDTHFQVPTNVCQIQLLYVLCQIVSHVFGLLQLLYRIAVSVFLGIVCTMEHVWLCAQRHIIQWVGFVWLVRQIVSTAVLQDVLCVILLTSSTMANATQAVLMEPLPTEYTAILTPACTTAVTSPMDACRVSVPISWPL